MTIYPWMLYFFKSKQIWQRSFTFCVIWGFLDWFLYVSHTMLFAWATIERHILIFHETWISTNKQKILLHYFPMIFILIYLFIFYVIMYFFPPCQNYHQSANLLCIFPCLYDKYILSMWDFIVDQLFPILIIVIFSIALFIRVLKQKQRMCRTIHWRKHRKMTIQLLSISFVYLIILLPYAIVYIIRLSGLKNAFSNEFYAYTVFFSYFILLLFPFVCALSLPESQIKLKNFFQLKQRQQPPKATNPLIFTVVTPDT